MSHKKHLEIIKPSIEKIQYICTQCIEHKSSWWEFKDRINKTMAREESIIEMLENTSNETKKEEVKDGKVM